MTDVANLEVEISRRGPGTYSVSMRQQGQSKRRDTQTDIRTEPEEVVFDLEAFRKDTTDAALDLDGSGVARHGQTLGDAFFGGEHAARVLHQAIATNPRLRLRLHIQSNAMELHDLLWETVPDPTAPTGVAGATLAMSEQILFSRYLSSDKWQVVQLRRKGDLKALVAIADPTNVDAWSNGVNGPPLARINVARDLALAKSGLEACGIAVDVLAAGENAALGNATLDNIEARLREGEGYDIFYLVCHGQWIEGQPKLWLEQPDGTADVIAGGRLVHELWELEHKPRLVVLASCMSASGDAEAHAEDRGELAAVGPLIASAGVSAVLAMQGNVTMETIKVFMPAFFASLLENGLVDQAVASARAAVKNRPDAWMPVLFMRLQDGSIWYEPEMVVSSGQDEFDWEGLLDDICAQRCTVFLGPGLLEGLVGAPRMIARRWAQKRAFPLPPHEMDDLPHVAQYVHTQVGDAALRDDLRNWFTDRILEHYSEDLPPEVRDGNLLDVMDAVGKQLRQDNLEPHKVLARLPFPVYITTNPDNLLTAALTESGRRSRQEVFRWHVEDREYPQESPLDGRQFGDAIASNLPWDAPLVYHLYGHLDQHEHHSRVMLTEDDYFDYLIGATADKDTIPLVVREALANSALLFIGFQMSDWGFRVLMRIIASQPKSRLKNYHHVAVQVRPEEGRGLDTAWARKYLVKYFDSANIGSQRAIYWGSSADFLTVLDERWVDRFGAYPTYPINFGELAERNCKPTRRR